MFYEQQYEQSSFMGRALISEGPFILSSPYDLA